MSSLLHDRGHLREPADRQVEVQLGPALMRPRLAVEPFGVLLAILVALSCARIYYILHCPFDLSADEAQYWEWSRRLDLSYYSKGPLAAYLIAASTHLFGNTTLGVRFPAVILSDLTSLVLYFLGIDMAAAAGIAPGAHRAAAFISALSVQAVPLFAVYGVAMTTDAPLMLLWALALYVFWIGVKNWLMLGKARLWHWMLLGAVVGAGVMAKYTMAFFYLCGLLYLRDQPNVSKLRGRPVRIALLLSLIFMSPVLVWNLEHGFVTIRHVAGQADLYDGLRIEPGSFAAFLGEQPALITPIVLGYALAGLIWLRKSLAGRMLFWFSTPILAFLALKSLQGKVQGNWVLPAYIAAMVAMSLFVAQRWPVMGNGRRTLIAAGFALALAATAIIHFPLKPFGWDPTARLRGWKQLGEEVSDVADRMPRPYFLASDDIHVVPELSFYVKGQPQAYCSNFGRRMTQYDLWPGFENLVGYNALMVSPGESPLAKLIGAAFSSCRQHRLVVNENGAALRDYTLFECYGFKGMRKPPLTDF